MRFVPGSTRSLHPLARVALLLVGAALFCAILVLGAMVLAVLIGVGVVAMLARRWWQRPPAQARDPQVLEGTCVVLDKSQG